MKIVKVSKQFQAALVLAASGLFVGCAEQAPPKAAADLLLTGGKIYTADKKQPWVEAVAIKGDTIVSVGSSAELEQLRGPKTEVVNLEGKMAMPGLIDGHVHPVLGGMELATQCLFPASAEPQQIKQTLTECMQSLPAGSWLVGGRWDSAFFSRNEIASPAKWLDQFSGDHPVSLADDTGHNRWVNSKALALAGLDKNTRIEGGEIVLDDNGEPNGLLLEAAMYPVLSIINRDLKPTPEQYLQAARISLATANQYGITGVNEAGDADQGVIAYRKLDQAGELNAHIEACIAVALTAEGELDLERLQRIREQNRSKHVSTDCAKLFLDGVPSEARTAAVLDDYTPDADGHQHNGKLLIAPSKLKQFVAQLDALGMTVKVHVAGDRSVRETLDAVAYARQQNGDSGLRHELAHSGLIDPTDIQRLAKLNVVADMSPSIWYPSPVTDSIVAALGERGQRYWPFKNLIEAGAEVIAGSDWPAVVPNMNLWPGIESMITRQHPDGAYPGELWPEQTISLQQALEIYTINGARTLNMENSIGSLTAGKLADIIVLNQNLFDIPVQKISETQVELTYFEGREVYRRGD